jgi:hypothetical protein
MAPLAWMVGLAAGSWLAIRLTTGGRLEPEVLLGMLGPLVSAVLTWVAVERTQRRAPARVTSVMIAGFALKMVLFGVYVVAMLRPLALRPIPFVVSFAGYFIALHVVETVFLRRLLTSTPR